MANAASTPLRDKERPKKRAIALAGGGPAAGFHIGVLRALEKYEMTFDVWSLSCIGAWVGVHYNQCSGKASQTHDFFSEHAFRDTESYRGFPVNKAFAPNLEAYMKAWWDHATNAQTYASVFNTNDLPDAAVGWTRFLMSPHMWGRQGDRNAHVLNNILAVHPTSRFLTSMLYLSEINGLSNIYYKDSTFLDDIGIDKLDLLDVPGLEQMSRAELKALAASYDPARITRERKAVPEIYHNAWRVADHSGSGAPGQLQLFNNKWFKYQRDGTRDYLPITRPSLCACSALPYVEQTVKIPNDGGNEYSEGALIDTVSFRNLVEDHPDLDEIWVCRILDNGQVRMPKNLHDSLGNLCEQFAAEVGENDIALFKSHLRKSAGRTPRVVEIQIEPTTKINYRWDRENLKLGFDEGVRAVDNLMASHQELKLHETCAPAWIDGQ